MRINLSDLEMAVEYISAGEGYGNEAYLSRATGEIFYHSELGDNEEELPGDIENEKKYVMLPSRKELSLGAGLAMAFVEAQMPSHLDVVRNFFQHKGAYGRFKAFLEQHSALDAWYRYESDALHKALQTWCKENGLTLIDDASVEPDGSE